MSHPVWRHRAVPEPIAEWQNSFTPPITDLGPVAYLNEPGRYLSVLAAAWLFNPATVEYRGGVFLEDRFSPDGVDVWSAHLHGDVAAAEAAVNQTVLFDLFTQVNVDACGEYAAIQLAQAIGECWQGVLAGRYPGRAVSVVVTDEEDGAYGPTVTFSTAGPG
ncbi:hypothetical protein [Allonocardiopsis opalescens]|uniref:Uncharacterized protein n=1 Tax=Allonocardiopsis opalescens TaxID=1144618 RepID=A0A2T0Q7U3_9ACTN|nr:hypothetical protein [Allonocardiopsis opalescens]PRX99889.1 hypothetical protein CLV72_103496 [Allonocardiopsis opalescens]